MKSLSDLEKKINSELTTKINDSNIFHEQLYLSIDNEDSVSLMENFNIMSSNCGTCHKKFKN